MKTHISYECDVCGQTFDDKTKAEACEVMHKNCKDVVVEQFSAGDLYPERIKVLYRDGKSNWYVLDKKNKE